MINYSKEDLRKDLQKKLVTKLRSALDLAHSINALDKEGTDEYETSFSVGWFIKEALLLLDDTEFLEWHWFKNFILTELT